MFRASKFDLSRSVRAEEPIIVYVLFHWNVLPPTSTDDCSHATAEKIQLRALDAVVSLVYKEHEGVLNVMKIIPVIHPTVEIASSPVTKT